MVYLTMIRALLAHLAKGLVAPFLYTLYVRDVTFAEDDAMMRSGSGPHILVALRNPLSLRSASLLRMDKP